MTVKLNSWRDKDSEKGDMWAVVISIRCICSSLSKPGTIIAVKKQIEINALLILPDKVKTVVTQTKSTS